MSWELFHERNAFTAELIERATVDAEAALDFTPAQRASVERLFGNEEQLLLALRQKWMTNLSASLDQAIFEDRPLAPVPGELARSRPGLRALLDIGERRFVRLRALQRGEPMMIASHGAPDVAQRTVA
ncbi:hypothetical protein MINS_00940 [Mycolicibacterium insubricum]|jgi:ATP adenylyltransferase|uniref:Uncharacterized protein n=1 Tax=Mycolicibacterium insubricum TaxID=444597 RepID=A0A1X0D7B2_9MYCO|nr:hypothetical protein [Mycolicibacterium insubricum]MCV7082316.1 hypothetical protein [Mycolicibacterium insubricum]ORA67630.1 hypothetical protein BST26_15545 [Mycolicibacterium insubricum]BBZ64665.1 hypothetical protein MINS_00940 [Mycolicibacterium insubricum]